MWGRYRLNLRSLKQHLRAQFTYVLEHTETLTSYKLCTIELTWPVQIVIG